MAYLEWNDRFNTGVARIDLQHRRLVDFLNELNRRLGVDIELQVDPVSLMHEKAKKQETDGIILLNPDFADKQGYLKTRLYYRSYPVVIGTVDIRFDHQRSLQAYCWYHRLSVLSK